MTDPSLPALSDVERDLQRLGVAIDPAELHGGLCGWLAGGGQAPRGGWLVAVMTDATMPDVEDDSVLGALHAASARQLEAPDFGFDLLLPPASADLDVRADALLAWCRGFLGGFGLASGASPPLSEEGGEALADLGRIAASALDYDDPDADEDALAEIEEFVRVAALLLHSDCVLGPRHRRQLH